MLNPNKTRFAQSIRYNTENLYFDVVWQGLAEEKASIMSCETKSAEKLLLM